MDRIKVTDEDLELYKLKANKMTKDELELIKTIDYLNSKDSFSYDLLVKNYLELKEKLNLFANAYFPLRGRYSRLALVDKYINEIFSIIFCMDNIIGQNKRASATNTNSHDIRDTN